nr:exosortase C-terminal domain/associated protein EpsI [Polymorphobacter multimanifer]
MVAAAQIGTAVAAYAATPRALPAALTRTRIDDLVPETIGDWRFVSAAGVIATTEAADTEGYDQLLKRFYRAPGQPDIMLLMAYGNTQGGSLQLHRPETCFPAQGFGLSEFRAVALDFDTPHTIQARAFTARRDDRIERLLYWTRIGGAFPRTSAEEYLAILQGLGQGTVPDGMLVRISSLGSDIAASDRAIMRFVSAMIGMARPDGRELLVGQAMADALDHDARAG